MKKTERKITGWNYINLALTAFGGLGLEALYAYLLEPIIYGAQMPDWTENQMICHWIITCITWGIMAFLLCRSSKKKYEFDLWAKGERVRAWQWIAVLCCVAVTIATSIINWNGFKVILEYQHNGALKFIFQYIYYFFETALFTLIIVFAQKAFETWFKRKNIPYGGIICAVTWGAAHIFTKGSVTIGLLSALCGFLYGTVYLLLGRDIKKTYVVLAVMFML